MLSENYLSFLFTALANGSGIMEGGESVLHACLLLEDEREEESITLDPTTKKRNDLGPRNNTVSVATLLQTQEREGILLYQHRRRDVFFGDNTRKRRETPLQTQEMGILW